MGWGWRENLICLQNMVNYSGRSRISQMGRTSLLFGQNFPKISQKCKKLDPWRGSINGAPPFLICEWIKNLICFSKKKIDCAPEYIFSICISGPNLNLYLNFTEATNWMKTLINNVNALGSSYVRFLTENKDVLCGAETFLRNLLSQL